MKPVFLVLTDYNPGECEYFPLTLSAAAWVENFYTRIEFIGWHVKETCHECGEVFGIIGGPNSIPVQFLLLI